MTSGAKCREVRHKGAYGGLDGDLGGVILTRALSFARERLRRVAALEPAALVAMVAPGADPAPVVADTQAAIARVRRHAGELDAALAVPLDTPERVQGAVDAFAGALAAASDGRAQPARSPASCPPRRWRRRGSGWTGTAGGPVPTAGPTSDSSTPSTWPPGRWC